MLTVLKACCHGLLPPSCREEEEPALNAEDAFKAALNKKIMLGGPGPRPPRGSKPDEAAEGGGGEKKKAPAHTAEQDALAKALHAKLALNES